MQISDKLLEIGLPMWAGASFAAIGIAYQAAQKRGVGPIRLLGLLAWVGTAFFVVKCALGGVGDGRGMLLGIATGLGQYLTVRLMGRAMRLGPFSPIWCMLSLQFVPVALYAALIQQQQQGVGQWVGVGAAVLCCLLAAAGVKSDPSTSQQPPRVTYAILLLLILFINAMPNITIQARGSSDSSLNGFFLCMYAAMALTCSLDGLVAGELASSIKRAWIPGVFGAAGSVSGLLSLAASPARPSTFLISSIVSLLLPMLAAVLFYSERAGLRWVATMALGLAAIACSYK
jgi:hypothetical protein